MEKKLTLSQKKRQLIVSEAKKIFLKHGFDATSMDEITRQSGVSKKTVYHHFSNKTELFRTVIVSHWEGELDSRENTFLSGKTPKERLHLFAENLYQFIYRPDTIALYRVLIAESERFPDLGKSLLERGHPPLIQSLIEYLTSERELQIQDTNMAASQLVGMLKQNHYWNMMLGFEGKPGTKRLQNIINEAVTTFLTRYKS